MNIKLHVIRITRWVISILCCYVLPSLPVDCNLCLTKPASRLPFMSYRANLAIKLQLEGCKSNFPGFVWFCTESWQNWLNNWFWTKFCQVRGTFGTQFDIAFYKFCDKVWIPLRLVARLWALDSKPWVNLCNVPEKLELSPWFLALTIYFLQFLIIWRIACLQNKLRCSFWP